jgi:hypothetical protein
LIFLAGQTKVDLEARVVGQCERRQLAAKRANRGEAIDESGAAAVEPCAARAADALETDVSIAGDPRRQVVGRFSPANRASPGSVVSIPRRATPARPPADR